MKFIVWKCFLIVVPYSGIMPLTICHTGMQQHFICMLTTQIQCAFKKYNVHTNKNVWECSFYFSNSTTRHKTVCRQAKKHWVGGKAVASYGKKKKTGSHDWMRYLIFWLEPSPPFGVWELHFLPLLQAQPARETSSEYPVKIKPTIFIIPVSCSNHWVTSTPSTSLLYILSKLSC